MKRTGKIIIQFVKEMYWRWNDSEVIPMSASVAYFFLLSLFPFLLFIAQLLTFFPVSLNDLLNVLAQYAPEGTIELVKQNLRQIVGEKSGKLLSIGALVSIYFASNAANAIMHAINHSYKIKETRHFLIVRLISVIITLSMMFLLAFALLVPVFGHSNIEFVHKYIDMKDSLIMQLSGSRWIISFFVLYIAFMLLFAYAPAKRMKLKQVYPGAIFATLGWMISSFGFSFYVNNFGNYVEKYGSISSIVVLLIWFFLTGFVIIIGGQINAVIDKMKQEGW
ncbi:MAG: YihY/virulence factor BrkB family protein [Bacilli bacterium]